METADDDDLDPFLVRFREACDSLGSRTAVMAALDCSRSALARYMRGENEPGFRAMASLAKAAGVSLEWLAWGTGQREGGAKQSDDAMFHTVVERVFAYMKKRRFDPTPADLADLCIIVLDLLRDDLAKDPQADVSRYGPLIDFIIQRLDREAEQTPRLTP